MTVVVDTRALANGHFARVVHRDVEDSLGNDATGIFIEVLDPLGNIIASDLYAAGSTNIPANTVNAESLFATADGGFGLVWKREVYEPNTESRSVTYTLFDSAGVEISGSARSISSDSPGFPPSSYFADGTAAGLANGNIVSVDLKFQDGPNPINSEADEAFTLRSADGTVLATRQLATTEDVEEAFIVDTAGGGFAIAYATRGGTTVSIETFDAAGAPVAPVISLAASDLGIVSQGIAAVSLDDFIALSDGGFALSAQSNYFFGPGQRETLVQLDATFTMRASDNYHVNSDPGFSLIDIELVDRPEGGVTLAAGFFDSFAVERSIMEVTEYNAVGSVVDTATIREVDGLPNPPGGAFEAARLSDGRLMIMDDDGSVHFYEAFDVRGDPIVGADAFDDVIAGNSGDNTIAGLSGDDTLYGLDGDDVLQTGFGNDFADGGDGNDTLSGFDGNDTLYGRNGDDLLLGGDGTDLLIAGEGADNLQGGAGNDNLFGEGGHDLMQGGDGVDVLVGGAGNDTGYGNAGNDYVYGGLGNDVLVGGDGVDVLLGQEGDDYAYGGADRDYAYGGTGTDVLQGEGGSDILYGEAGNDTLIGGTENDYLYGGDGNDSLQGGEGVDVMFGEAGADTLRGGAGTDYIFSETGGERDTIIHGLGDGTDVIYSFDVGIDVLRLEDSGFANFAEVQAATSNFGGFSVITRPDGGSVWLIGVTREDLTDASIELVSTSRGEPASEARKSEMQRWQEADLAVVDSETAPRLDTADITYEWDSFGSQIAVLEAGGWDIG